MRKEKIIIFDFDGVIADTFEIAFGVRRMSNPGLTREHYRELFDGNIYDTKPEDAAVDGIDFFTEYGKRCKTLGIDKEIKSIIKKLSKDYRLFIVSSTISFIINECLSRHKILDCFIEVLGSDVETSKVKKFNMIFEKHKISPAEAIFISDTSGDIKEAKEVKINFIVGILGGFQARASLEKAAPDAIAGDFNDFFRIIREK